MENNLNYSNEKNNKTTNVLLILVLIVGVILIGLLSYKMFIYDKKDNKENKDNNIVNKDDNKNKHSYYAYKDINEINKMVETLNYSSVTDKVKHDDMLKSYYISTILLDELKKVGYISVTDRKFENKDSLGNVYPNYESNSLEYILRDLGLSVPEIEKWNKSNLLGGQYSYELYKADIIKEKYPEMYSEIFNESFEMMIGNTSDCRTTVFIYNKDTDKIIINRGGCTATYTKTKIIDENLKDDTIIVKFAEAVVEPLNELKSGIYNNSKSLEGKYACSEIKNNDIDSCILASQDELNQYEVTFKKSNDYWYFDSVKKLTDDEKVLMYGKSDNSFKYLDFSELNLSSIKQNVDYEKEVDGFKIKYTKIDNYSYKVIIDNKFDASFTELSCSINYGIFYNNDYVVIQKYDGCGAAKPLMIYDRAWNLKFESKRVRSSYIKNNILYYVETNDSYYESCESNGEYKFMSIDLTNMNKNERFKFKDQIRGLKC